MDKSIKKEIISFIEPNIQTFHKRRLENLMNLELTEILKRKNPYLFKAKNITTAQDLVKSLLDAYLSSQEEGIFGGFFAVNGCCYGRDDNPDKGDCLKLCGQTFWEFISGNENLYIEIIEPLGYEAKKKNENFLVEYSKVINKFTFKFAREYCDSKGNILWNKLVRFNSGKIKRVT